MVSIKISRGKFHRPGPSTSALRMLFCLTVVKTFRLRPDVFFSLQVDGPITTGGPISGSWRYLIKWNRTLLGIEWKFNVKFQQRNATGNSTVMFEPKPPVCPVCFPCRRKSSPFYKKWKPWMTIHFLFKTHRSKEIQSVLLQVYTGKKLRQTIINT